MFFEHISDNLGDPNGEIGLKNRSSVEVSLIQVIIAKQAINSLINIIH
jgi:hypothetical protein